MFSSWARVTGECNGFGEMAQIEMASTLLASTKLAIEPCSPPKHLPPGSTLKSNVKMFRYRTGAS